MRLLPGSGEHCEWVFISSENHTRTHLFYAPQQRILLRALHYPVSDQKDLALWHIGGHWRSLNGFRVKTKFAMVASREGQDDPASLSRLSFLRSLLSV